MGYNVKFRKILSVILFDDNHLNIAIYYDIATFVQAQHS